MDEDLRTLLRGGEEIIASLEEVTFACLRNLDTLSQEDVNCFLVQRQQGAEELALFETNLREMEVVLEQGGGECHLLLENFRRSFRDALTGITEADALIRALAESRKMTIRTELDSVVQGHTAMQGYGGRRGKRAALGRIA
jgi:hypothetical protein